jgi:hypothetical protein
MPEEMSDMFLVFKVYGADKIRLMRFSPLLSLKVKAQLSLLPSNISLGFADAMVGAGDATANSGQDLDPVLCGEELVRQTNTNKKPASCRPARRSGEHQRARSVLPFYPQTHRIQPRAWYLVNTQKKKKIMAITSGKKYS